MAEAVPWCGARTVTGDKTTAAKRKGQCMRLGRCGVRAFFLCAQFLVFLFLAACATHPLGMSDEEWDRLTPEQRLEARKQDEQNQLERQKMRREEERRREEDQLKRDAANGMIVFFNPERPYCIGGDKWYRESFDELILSMRRMAEVDRVLFYADDNIGSRHEGKLSVYADNVCVARDIDVKKRGKWHQVLVGRPARNITLRGQTGDEINIHQVKIFGGWVEGNANYLILR